MRRLRVKNCDDFEITRPCLDLKFDTFQLDGLQRVFRTFRLKLADQDRDKPAVCKLEMQLKLSFNKKKLKGSNLESASVGFKFANEFKTLESRDRKLRNASKRSG